MLELSNEGRAARVSFTVNGSPVQVDIEPRETLVNVLRRRLGLTGTKIGCDAQVCGACTVLVDAKAVSSCTIFAFDVAGKAVTTIEGIAAEAQLHPLQSAFIAHGGFQCGYCTPGMIMASAGLLERNPDPTREQIVEWLGGNICRCTGYDGIVKAVQEAARAHRSAGSTPSGIDGTAATVPNVEAGEAADAEADANWDS